LDIEEWKDAKDIMQKKRKMGQLDVPLVRLVVWK
jgi:hypothetical protein